MPPNSTGTLMPSRSAISALLRWIGQTLVPPLVLFVVVAAVWQWLVDYYEVKPFLLPGPRLVLHAISGNAVKLLRASLFTGTAAVAGLAASLLAGTAVSFLFSQSRWIRNSSYPYALFLQTVPIVAIAPLIVHWCGRGYPSVILTAFIISLFPIIASGTAGLLQVDPDLQDLFRLNNATRWQVLTRLRFPNAVPALCTGVRTSCGLAVVGAVVGEFFAGYGGDQFGLGYLILVTTDQLRMAELFAAVLASTAVSVVIFAATGLVTQWILDRWYDV